MDFKGGVIVTGSLLWDKNILKWRWRTYYRDQIPNKTPVKLKIRYGGHPGFQDRCSTYTVIFSNHPTTEFGLGYIVNFPERIKSFRVLEKQANWLAGSESQFGDSDNMLVAKERETIGLLVNPNIQNKAGEAIIRERWKALFNNFNPNAYRIENEKPVIDADGFLQLDWTEEMNLYDFLIANVAVPDTTTPLTAGEIASQMIQNNYFEYFEQNRLAGISTFQDKEIEELLLSNKKLWPR